jgi:hypothetical protein
MLLCKVATGGTRRPPLGEPNRNSLPGTADATAPAQEEGTEMRINRNGLVVAFVAALLACGTVALTAQDEGMEQETDRESVSLTGQLNETADGGFVLIEPESGEEIVVEGPGLADHIGSSVTVTGTWATDEEGGTYLAVSSVTKSEA